MKAVAVRLAPNRYESELLIHGRAVPFEDARLEYQGKGRMLVVTFRDPQVLPDSRCPERGRYGEILKAFGDAAAIARLEPKCSMIRLNAKACTGCPDNPL